MISDLESQAREGEQKYWQNLAKVYQDALARLGSSEETSDAAIVSASKEVFDRAFGKVAEKVELQGEVNLHLDMENFRK